MSQDLIKFIPNPQTGELRVEYENGVYMGDLSRAHDLNWNFWPEVNGGFWSEHILRILCDKLAELNKPINDEFEAWCLANAPTEGTDVTF